jgi:uncharacterized membrane protein
MRKLLEAVSLFALLTMGWTTWQAFHGRVPLPKKIPTHFDAAGQPNGWGSPTMLLLLPCVAVLLYLTITLVSQFPSALNYPVRVTAQNRERLQQIALGMMAWIKAELCCLFAAIQYATIEAARRRQNGLPPALMPLALLVVFGTIGAHILAMRRA